MNRFLILYVFAVATWPLDLVQSDEGSLTEQFEDVKASAYRISTIEKSLENVLEIVKNLSTKVQVMGDAMKNFQAVRSNVDSQNNSPEKVKSQATGGSNSAVITNSSSDDFPNKIDTLTSAARYSRLSKSFVEGILVASYSGVKALSLRSLESTELPCKRAESVAFDWSSRKVYWIENYVGIKRAHLDGTNVEFIKGYAGTLAVDSITGNFYYRPWSSGKIRVCSRNAEVCSVIATNQLDAQSLALHPSKGIMFWSSNNSLMRANMDGSDPTVIRSGPVTNIKVAEDLDRVFFYVKGGQEKGFPEPTYPWLQKGHLLYNCDLNGKDCRVFRNFTSRSYDLAIHGDVMFFYELDTRDRDGLYSISKDGENLSFIATLRRDFTSMALYGSKANYDRENPCETASCSHLCVLKLESYACLCPEELQLGQDGKTCA